MRHNRYITILLVACACGLWIYNISLVADVVSLSMKRSPETRNVVASAALGSSSLVDRALSLQPSAAAVRFKGGFESPFKLVSEAHRNTSGGPRRPAAVPSRPRLVLKGVLYKSNPLAILEDANGATSILGIGDTLFGQKVAGITKTSVTLRDSHGTYDLSVKE
jgi:type II secretory pathway component PulC